MATKVFGVGDVLPATTQLRISWYELRLTNSSSVKTDTDNSLVEYVKRLEGSKL